MTSDLARVARLLPLLLIGLVAGACADSDSRGMAVNGWTYAPGGFSQWKLPKALREISGLALDSTGRLFAHDDERAVVYVLTLDGPDISKRFSLGQPPVRGDFEGIALHDDLIYLVTSSGILYVTQEGESEGAVSYQVIDTGVGKFCEVEGLDYEPANDALLIACKTARSEEVEGFLTVFRWSLATEELMPQQTIRLDLQQLREPLGLVDLNPSGIVVLPESENLLVLAGRQRVLVELTAAGALVAAMPLALGKAHRQAEGIAVTPVGDLIIADEGGDKRGRLSVYKADR